MRNDSPPHRTTLSFEQTFTKIGLGGKGEFPLSRGPYLGTLRGYPLGLASIPHNPAPVPAQFCYQLDQLVN